MGKDKENICLPLEILHKGCILLRSFLMKMIWSNPLLHIFCIIPFNT
jgi:hypothetical protein